MLITVYLLRRLIQFQKTTAITTMAKTSAIRSSGLISFPFGAGLGGLDDHFAQIFPRDFQERIQQLVL
jgi:hypothetical protein